MAEKNGCFDTVPYSYSMQSQIYDQIYLIEHMQRLLNELDSRG